MDRLKKDVFQIAKSEEGFMSILTILILSIVLSFSMFMLVEFIRLDQFKIDARVLTDRMANHAARSLDFEEGSGEGVRIDEREASTLASSLLIKNLNLTNNYEPTKRSNLTERPTYFIDFLYPETDENGYVETVVLINRGKSSVTINYPAVVVYTKLKPKTIWFKKDIPIEHYSVFEVEMDDSIKDEGELNAPKFKRVLIDY